MIDRRRSRVLKNRIFTVICWITASVSVLVLGVLLVAILVQGASHLDLDFLKNVPSRKAEEAGMGPAIWGSIWVCAVCGLMALPIGVATAVFLEEYRPKPAWARKIHGFIQLNIANLAGVPSIVYGILGLTAFVQVFGLFGTSLDPSFRIGVDFYDQFLDEAGNYLIVEVDDDDAPPVDIRDGMTAWTDIDGEPVTVNIVDRPTLQQMRTALNAETAPMKPDAAEAARYAALSGVVLEGEQPQRFDVRKWWYVQIPFGRGVLAGGLTLMLVILPIVIISSQEALRSVPGTLREGALGLGATKWQSVRRMTLPSAIPGIMTGSILAMSRAIGEAAPILVIAGIVYITFTPQHLMDDFTHMPLQIYNWAQQPQKEFHEVAASGIIVLLAILLTFNAAAVFIRQKFQKPLQ